MVRNLHRENPGRRETRTPTRFIFHITLHFATKVQVPILANPRNWGQKRNPRNWGQLTKIQFFLVILSKNKSNQTWTGLFQIFRIYFGWSCQNLKLSVVCVVMIIIEPSKSLSFLMSFEIIIKFVY